MGALSRACSQLAVPNRHEMGLRMIKHDFDAQKN
jgi:hypothetical protein